MTAAAPASPTGRKLNLSALRSADLRLYLLGGVFALNALWMSRVTIGWLAWAATESASFVGLIAFLYFAPTMVGGPAFGVLVDRLNLKRTAMTCQLAFAALTAAMAAAWSLDVVGRPGLVAFAAVYGCLAAIYTPLRMALAPRLVERASVGSVVSLVAINFNLARLTGPALAGILIATVGATWALWLIAVLYLPFVLIISRLRLRPSETTTDADEPFLAAFRTGTRYILGTRRVLAALGLSAVASFFLRGVLELLPVLADGVFARGATGLGMLTSAAGAGALAAGIGLAVSAPARDGGLRLPVYAAAAVGFGVMGLLPQLPAWAAIVGCIALIATAATYVGISVQTAVQMDLSDDLRGRVMGIWGALAIGSAATGAACLGAVTETVGFELTLTGGALGGILLTSLLFVTDRRAGRAVRQAG